MIIDFRQTASNIAQRFDITTSDGCHHGELGRFFRSQPITLIKADGTEYTAKRTPSNDNLGDRFVMYQQDVKRAEFARNSAEFIKSHYILYIGETRYDAHRYANGAPCYLSIYDGKRQIALLETPLESTAYRYTHTLYLLDEYKGICDELMMLVLYYCNYVFTRRFHMSYKELSEKRYIPGKAFDPEWKKRHFS